MWKRILWLAACGVMTVLLAQCGGGGGGGTKWVTSVDDETKEATAQLVKTPVLQTTCGTTVTNQLFVTNGTAQDIQLGTIEYEVVLAKDSPSGSCAAGRTGEFAPVGDTIVTPGQTLMIREWTNEVNPCSGCPYLSTECVWESRYVVHTSIGSAVARSTFSAKGDLCASSTGKICGTPSLVQPDAAAPY